MIKICCNPTPFCPKNEMNNRGTYSADKSDGCGQTAMLWPISELGVPLSDGYNGDLTSKQNGSVGGYMVKKMIEEQEKQMSGK